MTDYTNTYGGAAKDAADDIILGADVDTELDAVATMAATKSNKITSPDVDNFLLMDSNGDLKDSTYKLSELTDVILGAVYPVGHILYSTVATNPATTLGFTSTWGRIAEGRVLIGEGTGSGLTERTITEEIGTEDSVIVAHQHDAIAAHTHAAAGAHTHQVYHRGGGGSSQSLEFTVSADLGSLLSDTTSSDGSHSHASGGGHQHASEGVSGTDENLQPSLVVYIWERTA